MWSGVYSMRNNETMVDGTVGMMRKVTGGKMLHNGDNVWC